MILGGFEPAYLQKLALYLTDRFGERVMVEIAGSTLTAAEKDTVWIGSEEFLTAVRERERDALCIPLTEEEPVDGRAVYRYQSCEKLYQQIMPLYRKLCGISLYVPRAHRQRWLVITSDGAASELLAFSLTCAQVESRKGRTLYLNFSTCSGMEELLLLERGTDLCDLVAALRHTEEALCLEAFVRRTEQIDFVMPPVNPMILHELCGPDVERLIEAVEGQGDYASVIVALGTPCCGCEGFFRKAAQVLHLTQSGFLRECSQREWLELIALILGSAKTPVETIRMPQIKAEGSGMHLLHLWEEGALGQLARRYLEGEVQT